MKQHVTRDEAMKLIGKNIVAIKKDGTRVTGRLLKVSGNKLVLKRAVGKKVHTKAILPLVLFDLLAVATLPYAYGSGPGFGYGPGGGPGFGPGPKPGPGYGPGFGGGYGPGPGPGYGPYGPRPPGFF
ncbi:MULTISPECIES: hypothetical protein [Paenibacillus]|uniref:hypothetical protein n=1 Tax=Paenibacillus TaxID=44249 RepID=UPI0007BF02A5|nr:MULTISPECIES: hypothetical protein [Paenibacillus]MCZ1266082.1 hypothetical protein [Paenibacillus tundrae]WDQ35288.1 hypothetical protein PTQ21_14090 [Paenibacillus marchantiae]SDL86537.1 hypothetical protein SAMN05428961_107196 [Paenibacillus sp. OK060]SHN72325.1 hypothetical protein SAMN04487896_2982 [Paenibacillus sp. ov031]SLK13679.1 hypothetical protein SAMN06272722_108224 [Paenibacillus sp. RU5A]